MFLQRFCSLTTIALFFYGCSTINGAKALEFFSHIDEYGHWKIRQPTDFEGRILAGDVACIEAEILTFDEDDGGIKTTESARKCWDNFGILTEYFTKENSSNSVFHQKSKTAKGYLLSRTVDIHYPEQSGLTPRHFDLHMTESSDGSITTRTYTETSDSGKEFTVQFQTENDEKITFAQITHPYSHKLDYTYDEKGSVTHITDKDWGNSYRIDFTSDSVENTKTTKIIYQGETYSYILTKKNPQKQPIEVMYSDEFSREQIHRKYTYTQDGKTASIWVNGVSRNIIYNNGKFAREEYYDYGNTLRQVVEIETDSQGNVIKSSYFNVNSGKQNDKPRRQFKYTINYHNLL